MGSGAFRNKGAQTAKKNASPSEAPPHSCEERDARQTLCSEQQHESSFPGYLRSDAPQKTSHLSCLRTPCLKALVSELDATFAQQCLERSDLESFMLIRFGTDESDRLAFGKRQDILDAHQILELLGRVASEARALAATISDEQSTTEGVLKFELATVHPNPEVCEKLLSKLNEVSDHGVAVQSVLLDAHVESAALEKEIVDAYTDFGRSCIRSDSELTSLAGRIRQLLAMLAKSTLALTCIDEAEPCKLAIQDECLDSGSNECLLLRHAIGAASPSRDEMPESENKLQTHLAQMNHTVDCLESARSVHLERQRRRTHELCTGSEVGKSFRRQPVAVDETHFVSSNPAGGEAKFAPKERRRENLSQTYFPIGETDTRSVHSFAVQQQDVHRRAGDAMDLPAHQRGLAVTDGETVYMRKTSLKMREHDQ